MLVFSNCQSLLKFDKLKTAQTVYGMMVAAGYRNWKGVSDSHYE